MCGLEKKIQGMDGNVFFESVIKKSIRVSQMDLGFPVYFVLTYIYEVTRVLPRVLERNMITESCR